MSVRYPAARLCPPKAGRARKGTSRGHRTRTRAETAGTALAAHGNYPLKAAEFHSVRQHRIRTNRCWHEIANRRVEYDAGETLFVSAAGQ